MKFYHGTNVKFSEFDDEYLSGKNFGSGFYFTTNFEKAKDFCHLKDDRGGFVYECALKADSPFEVRNPKHAKMLSDSLGLKWKTVKADKSYLNTDRGYHPEDGYEFYLKIVVSLANMMGGEDTVKWPELEGDLHEVIRDIGFDSIFDSRLGYLMVFGSSQVLIKQVHKIGEYKP